MKLKKIAQTIHIILSIFMVLILFSRLGMVIWGTEVYPYRLVNEIPAVRTFALMVIPLIVLVLLLILLSVSGVMDSRERLHISLSQLYQSVFHGLSTGLLVLDGQGRIRYINTTGCRLLGWESGSPPQLMHYSELVDPLLVPVAEKLATSMESGERFTREYRVFLNSGVLCILCDFYCLRDSRLGRVFVISLEDRSREDEIKQKLSTQLEETHRYALSKDNFFANMSHEIRTPINAILGITYFARSHCSDGKCLEYISKIENASELLLSVVNDILDFSKMQEHKFSLNPENFNLFDLQKILTDLFALKAIQKSLELRIEFDCPQRFYVYGDQFRLTQIFMNLVSNALKFTENGFIKVSLNHENIGDDIILRCTVRDSGLGIVEKDLDKIFTDFEQFGQVLVKTHEGTGLGLAICKRLVELMHGVIWVDSLPGQGSSFHFVVVLKKPTELTGEELSMNLPRIERHSGRILVVEDNEINGEIVETLLAREGLEVLRATNGLEAIDICREKGPDAFDLVLMDIHMPRMNGYDAARVLKQEIGIRCPIIAVTATSENTRVLEENGDIIDGYIIKPYDPEVFHELFS